MKALLVAMSLLALPTPQHIPTVNPKLVSNLANREDPKLRPAIVSASDPCVAMTPDSVGNDAFHVESSNYTTQVTPSGAVVKRACPAFVVQVPFRDAQSWATLAAPGPGVPTLSKADCATLHLSAVAVAPRDDGTWKVIGEVHSVGKWEWGYNVCSIEAGSIAPVDEHGLTFGADWRWVVRAWYDVDQRPLPVSVSSGGGISASSGGPGPG